MRRSNTLPISELLRQFVDENNLGRKLKEVDVVQSWGQLLGKTIAHYTKNVTLKNKILYVEITSSVVKNELFMMRDEICRKINQNAGQDLVERIVFK